MGVPYYVLEELGFKGSMLRNTTYIRPYNWANVASAYTCNRNSIEESLTKILYCEIYTASQQSSHL